MRCNILCVCLCAHAIRAQCEDRHVTQHCAVHLLVFAFRSATCVGVATITKTNILFQIV